MYATVVIDISSKQLNRLFDYKIPSSLERKIKKGMRVVVDFNNRKRLAYVVDVIETSKYATKEILYVLDEKPTLTNTQLKLVEYLQSKSFSTYVEAFNAAIPEALHGKYEYTFKVIECEKLAGGLKEVVQGNLIDIKKVKEEDFNIFNEALEKGYIKKQTKIKDKVKISYTKNVYIKDVYKKLTPKQELIIQELSEPKTIEELIELGHSKDIIERLIKQNVLGFELVEKYKSYEQSFHLSETIFELTSEQENAVKKVELNRSGRYLLYGPPASGKTEIYLRLIERVLKDNKQVLVLVPEISLIPQMVSRVVGRFSHSVAVYHSSLTAKMRYDNYRKIKEGKVKIIIGTRSSIFLPIADLGLIVLDEAHDLSFIQKTRPYYDTKEISFLLAEMKKCPVVFGTATPTASMFYDAKLGKLKLLKLSTTISKHNVNVKLVDMKQELLKGNLSMFSNDLKIAIKKTLEKNEQIIVLVNRRGYAPFVLCRTCGYVYKCDNCKVSLVYHKSSDILKCHHCGYEEKATTTCKVCKSKTIKPVGFGTEQVEEELLKEFPTIRVLRMDSDTTSKRGSHDEILTDFLNKKADVLLGTQMVSKGHHFDNVSLVVVMLIDQMLNLSSYLANEKTYNLLTQHIGRIRNKNGHAILQAYDTDHYVLKSILKNDESIYYDEELKMRKLLKLEPFYNVVKITFKGKDQYKTYSDLERLKNNFLAKNTQMDGFGPSENYIFYSNDRYNYSVTFKSPKSFKIDSIMNYFDRKYTKDYYIDIDYYPDEV